MKKQHEIQNIYRQLEEQDRKITAKDGQVGEIQK